MFNAHFECIGYDKHGVPRCYGFGPSADIAETGCWREIRDYVARRPDTGPVDSWDVLQRPK